MGLRGPQPKPSNLRVLEGNPGHKPLNPNEPRYPPGVPDRPRGMSRAAGEIWDELVREMGPTKVLRRVDKAPLRQLCEDQALYNEAVAAMTKLRQQLAKKAKAANQELPGNSALLSLMQSQPGRRMLISVKEMKAQLILQRREFGLTPASNCRVSAAVAAADLEDALDLALLA